ncbi:DUF222 domain-containing protein [Arthrobacter echini]|uniref:DUF222 domain-containing protein n=1 Tax=Arthrobacter echini TaxID=1529066 RepID=A0A5D0XQ63_9MICC|nr:HNH endonuclease signature motif containing protein [Arthrobacter echini]TYC98637.1 DUF222 domain-containing protein [Arthrobacter echini]
MDSSREAPQEKVTARRDSTSRDAGPADVRGLISDVASLRLAGDSAELIDQIRGLEDLTSAIAAMHARAAVAFDLAQRREQAAAGVPAAKQGEGVSAQLALARRQSPSRGNRLLGLAHALVIEMPHTLTALETGQLNEWRATLLVRETACLSAADRCAVDEELAADAGTFNGAGDRALIAAARTATYRRDPRSVTDRARHAAGERYVSLRPAPDTMAYLTALLPVAEAVAVYAELTRHTDSLRARGDPRGRGQLMADTLVERTTGVRGGVSSVEIQLVMTDRTLFQGDSEPARLNGYGVVPAGWAREMVCAETDPCGQELHVFLRRLFTAPASGDLLGVDSRSRLFTHAQRRFLEIRDHTCRTPYCDAPIRHHDHIVPWHHGGSTSLLNGAGLCEACNHTKELAGWRSSTRSGPRHTIDLRTPTGHTYRSLAPPLLGSDPNCSVGAALHGNRLMRRRLKAQRHIGRRSEPLAA